MNGRPSGNVIRFQCIGIRQLLSAVNKLDLINTHTFPFLQGLLDIQYLIVRFKIVRLFATC